MRLPPIFGDWGVFGTPKWRRVGDGRQTLASGTPKSSRDLYKSDRTWLVKFSISEGRLGNVGTRLLRGQGLQTRPAMSDSASLSRPTHIGSPQTNEYDGSHRLWPEIHSFSALRRGRQGIHPRKHAIPQRRSPPFGSYISGQTAALQEEECTYLVGTLRWLPSACFVGMNIDLTSKGGRYRGVLRLIE